MKHQGISARSPPCAARFAEPQILDHIITHSIQTDKEKVMKVLYINNLGGGYADYVDVTDGTTVEQFFSKRMRDCNPEDFLIRVNRQPVAKNYALQEGDRITITPTKIEGARK